MDGTLPADDALALGRLLGEHRGTDVAVLDLRGLNSWTDFFVIATVSSNAHLQGLERHIQDFVAARGLEVLRPHRKPAPDDEWDFIDLGTMVVHLMTPRAREFYELERLWGTALRLVEGEEKRAPAAE